PHEWGGQTSASGEMKVSVLGLCFRLWLGLFGRFFRLLGFGFGLAQQAPPLADARRAPNLASQVVQAPLAHVAVAQDLDLVDARRVDHERPLHADAMRDAPDREVLAQAATRDADDRALEHLDALARALDDLGMHLH